MMKKIVISGATGAVGIALVNYALEQQMEVLVVCHKNSHRMALLPRTENLRILELDVEEYSDFLNNKSKVNALGKYDCFFHLAWKGTTGTFRNDVNLQLRNVGYTLDAVKLAASLGCKCFIGAGSQAEYGRKEGKLTADAPTFPENGYGIAKLCAGQMSRILCEQVGIRHIWARILSVYGPGDRSDSLIMSAILGFLKCQSTEFTAGMQKWDYLYSNDAARILIGLANFGEHGRVYCVGSGESRLLKDYIHQIYVAINGNDVSDERLGIGSLPYADKQVMYIQADVADWPEELQQDLKERPMCSFSEGIRYTIDWISSLGYERNV